MKVGNLIKVLQELDPELDIYHIQGTGIVAPILSVQEVSYVGFKPDTFVGLCCGKSIERKDMLANPVYISQTRT